MELEIREARREDCKEIGELIQELAQFEKMPTGPKINHEGLEKDGFDTEPPLFKAFVAIDGKKIIGLALYYYTYSSWEGKSMFLDDFYITPEYRNKGIGSRMFDTVTKKAVQENCSRLEFSVLSWNRAKKFYNRKGAVDLTESEDWHHYRLDCNALKKMAQSQ